MTEFEIMYEKLDMAVRNALALANHNQNTNSQCPSTNVHELVGCLQTIKKI